MAEDVSAFGASSVEPEEQGADRFAVGGHAETGYDTVRRTLDLDLDHRTSPGLIEAVGVFGDDAVDAVSGVAVEPHASNTPIARRRTERECGRSVRQRCLEVPTSPL